MTSIERTDWDDIIVGAGSAGCVFADRFSAGLGRRALLLEASGSDKSIFIQMPAATQKNGSRCSAARAFVDPVRHRRNLTIATRTDARRIVIEGARATGLEVVSKGRPMRLRCRGEIIVSAGAIASPQLLLASGVGPAQDLEHLGIDVVSQSPDAGRNLQDHPGLGMTLGVSIPTYDDEMALLKQVLHGANWLFRGRGARTTPDAHLVGFLKSSPEEPEPDIRVAGHGELVLKRSSCTTVVGVCRPRSRRRITLRGSDPSKPPKIENRVLGDPDDLNRLARGIRAGHGIIRRSPLKEIVTDPIMPNVTSGNLNAPCMMIGKRAATMILENQKA